MINMSEELKELQIRSKRNARIATAFLLGAMGVMGLWGWTPLKNIIPGSQILFLFLGSIILAMVFTVLTTYQSVRVKHMKARNEDQ